MLPAVIVLLAVPLLIVVPISAVILWTARMRRKLDDREFASWFKKFLFGIEVPPRRADGAGRKRTADDDQAREKRAS